MNYSSGTDFELWQRCRKDDMSAYNELFDRYYPKLIRLAARFVKDSMVAEELCMDQLFLLWSKRHQIEMHTDFSGYVFRSMRNLIITYLRKNIPVMMNIEELGDINTTVKTADYYLLSEEANAVYENVLKELSPQRRKVFSLCRDEQLSYKEIAQEMNLSVNTVENYMAAALEVFREKIKYYTINDNTLMIIIGTATFLL